MHIPAAHQEANIPILQRFIHETPLGVLTTAIPSEDHHTILSSHIPFVLDVDPSKPDDLGRLRGHLARGNPQAKAMISSLSDSSSADHAPLSQEVNIMFTAAPHHYVTPKFYTETKPTTAKVVPTWNYAAVQVYGKATIYADSKGEETSNFLSQQIEDLSAHAETNVMDYTGRGDRPGPWKVGDAPEKYIELMKKNIIGIEIRIESLEGKFKMSQEMRLGDREGVVKGFGGLGSDVGKTISELVRERSDLKEATLWQAWKQYQNVVPVAETVEKYLPQIPPNDPQAKAQDDRMTSNLLKRETLTPSAPSRHIALGDGTDVGEPVSDAHHYDVTR